MNVRRLAREASKLGIGLFFVAQKVLRLMRCHGLAEKLEELQLRIFTSPVERLLSLYVLFLSRMSQGREADARDLVRDIALTILSGPDRHASHDEEPDEDFVEAALQLIHGLGESGALLDRDGWPAEMTAAIEHVRDLVGMRWTVPPPRELCAQDLVRFWREATRWQKERRGCGPSEADQDAVVLSPWKAGDTRRKLYLHFFFGALTSLCDHCGAHSKGDVLQKKWVDLSVASEDRLLALLSMFTRSTFLDRRMAARDAARAIAETIMEITDPAREPEPSELQAAALALYSLGKSGFELDDPGWPSEVKRAIERLSAALDVANPVAEVDEVKHEDLMAIHRLAGERW